MSGWRIDIKSETRAAEAELQQYASFDGSAVEEEEEAAEVETTEADAAEVETTEADAPEVETAEGEKAEG